ncbi:hypothetical protein K504DRAFT_168115 [Pleomassaria siparia CBS 279.74]|uniref:Uncharacterized protein n=1 Tax=Pleomassaria siparia CBS 279.74 TaxID=1314801 RepID=A0A6G1JTN0_9PLEO|nr:hypothetical protein K504DRAFT_168115 [Pleomassaria siparia CBS 279.74]
MFCGIWGRKESREKARMGSFFLVFLLFGGWWGVGVVVERKRAGWFRRRFICRALYRRNRTFAFDRSQGGKDGKRTRLGDKRLKCSTVYVCTRRWRTESGTSGVHFGGVLSRQAPHALT